MDGANPGRVVLDGISKQAEQATESNPINSILPLLLLLFLLPGMMDCAMEQKLKQTFPSLFPKLLLVAMFCHRNNKPN